MCKQTTNSRLPERIQCGPHFVEFNNPLNWNIENCATIAYTEWTRYQKLSISTQKSVYLIVIPRLNKWLTSHSSHNHEVSTWEFLSTAREDLIAIFSRRKIYTACSGPWFYRLSWSACVHWRVPDKAKTKTAFPRAEPAAEWEECSCRTSSLLREGVHFTL